MKKIALFLLLGMVWDSSLPAQVFGQNKVQYHDFDWQYIQSPHFDIYFYRGGRELADFTSSVAEEAYEQISKHLRWELKKPVSIIIYNSHNDFQQTNVVSEYMPEGVGGVTELFKNRVVLPFEGSYEQFRHVIHHELVHALINDMVYGGNIQSIISGRVRLRLPLWVNEGLAEYLSMNWDTRADMILRDIAIHEHMPHINDLYGFLAYKGGQSIWRFIAEKYGREKVGEILISMKQTQSAEKGFERAIGMDYDELTDQWHTYLKKEYWPDIAGRQSLKDIAKPLTDHTKRRNYYNISPSLSPDGSKIAILSDRSGYADIYLIDAVTGKEIRRLVKGNRSIDFEELKWLQPGISWSPDSKQIVIAAKAGSRDVFHLIDVETGKSKKIEIPLDGLFSAAFSPDGKQLAFVGNHSGASDIYLYDLETRSVTNLTQDPFSDSEPVWSPDGQSLIFVSDRGANTYTASDDFAMAKLDYDETDLYRYSLATGEITPLTHTPYNENYPVWIRGRNELFYTADHQGVWNIFRMNLDTGEAHPITNVLTGIQQLSLSTTNDLLVFAGYNQSGWDIYSLSEPLSLPAVKVEPSHFITAGGKGSEDITDLRETSRKQFADSDYTSGDYSGYIFAHDYEDYNKAILAQNNNPGASLEQDSSRTADLRHPRPYKTRFTLDMVSGNLTISNVFGTQGMTYFAWSDILGDHQFTLGTEMVLTLENSDYFFSYGYLKHRTDFYFSAYQTADFFSIGYIGLGRLRHYGAAVYLSRPFNKYSRLDFGLSYHVLDYRVYQQIPFTNQYQLVDQSRLDAVLPGLSWVVDNSVSGFTGPEDGYRHNISLNLSPAIDSHSLSFQTLQLDFRKYYRIQRDYSLASRIMVGKSFGAQAQKFFLGGVPYWLFGLGETNGKKDNGQFRQVILDNDNQNLLQDIYFTEYAMPVRGSRYAERVGTNVALANFEIRFPFINYLAFGFPLKVIFGNIRGHAFLDVGAAWDSGKEFTSSTAFQSKYGDTVPANSTPFIAGFGLGMKINLGYFLLRIDSAWEKSPDGRYSRPQYYFSLGPDW
ncbi:MAG: hypothetical protein D6762_06310 [Candidatus Neomarinimicrobiota bacterium]|nr:MAG: hypothetical protein D6762_06310 [Candidatus Neomarinimicrobiota bacterium]